MNMKSRSLLAVAVALSLALPGMASADRRGGEYRDHGDRHGYKQSHNFKKSHRDRHHDRRDGYRDGHGYRDRYITRYYRDDDNDDLLVGLLVGGVLGYAINGAQHSNAYDYSNRYPRAQQQAYPAESYAYSDDTCLQEREYQTTIVVGGKNVPAYGTACLQPDGSWKRDTPQLVSY